jgi:DNA-binding MarR family transcriptional regulator
VRPDTGNDLVDAVLHAAHRIRTAADADLRKGGLSLPGYKLLKALAREDRSMREISDVLHVSPRTVTDIIDGLEARELVVRCAHPSDRRVTLLHLTEAGAVRLAEAAVGAEQANGAAISALDEDEQRILRDLLGRVAAPAPPATDRAGAGRTDRRAATPRG